MECASYIATTSRYIDMIYHFSRENLSFEDLPPTTVVRQEHSDRIKHINQRWVEKVREWLERAVQYNTEHPITDDQFKELLKEWKALPPSMDEDVFRRRLGLWGEVAHRDPFPRKDRKRSSLTEQIKQLKALQNMLQIQQMHSRYVQQWNNEIRNALEVRRNGNPRVWNTQWELQCERDSVGFRKGWVVFLMGLPGVGKTLRTAALNLFLDVYARNIPVAFYDGDMDRKEYTVWIPANHVAINIGKSTKRIPVDPSSLKARRIQNAPEFASYIVSFLDTLPHPCVLGSSFLPYDAQRVALAEQLKDRLFLIWCDASEQVRESRVKSRGYRTLLQESGIDDFEPPNAHSAYPAALTLNTAEEPLYRSIERIVLKLEEKGWLKPVGKK